MPAARGWKRLWRSQTAAAAAACKFGLDCHALLERRVPDRQPDYEETGNVLFDHMFGTSIEFRPAGLDMNAEAIEATNKLAKAGRKPYFIPGGGSNEIGALGYVSCAYETVSYTHLTLPTILRV